MKLAGSNRDGSRTDVYKRQVVDHAEFQRTIIKIHIWRTRYHSVEDIEKFHPELCVHAFGKVEVFG